jgi:hypothetical protein
VDQKTVVLLLLVTFLWGCGPRRHGEVHLIPEGYVGTVRVDYGVQGAAPLPLEHGKYVVRVPATGHVVTSTPFEEGSGRDEFYYVADSRRTKLAWGRGGMIQARRDGELPVSSSRPWERQRRENQGRFYSLYFVGTEQQQRAFEKSGADGPNESGPMPKETHDPTTKPDKR